MLFQNIGKSNLRSLADCEVFLQLYVETSVYYDTRVISGADQSAEVIVVLNLEDVLHLINSRVVGTIESSTQNGQGVSVCIARRHLIVLAVVSAARKSKIDNPSAAHSIFVFHVLVVRNHNIGHINRIIHSSRIPNLKLVSVISHNGILAEKPCRTFLSSYIYRNNSVHIGSNLHHWSRVIKCSSFLPFHAIVVKLSARFDTPSLILCSPNAIIVTLSACVGYCTSLSSVSIVYSQGSFSFFPTGTNWFVLQIKLYDIGCFVQYDHVSCNQTCTTKHRDLVETQHHLSARIFANDIKINISCCCKDDVIIRCHDAVFVSVCVRHRSGTFLCKLTMLAIFTGRSYTIRVVDVE